MRHRKVGHPTRPMSAAARILRGIALKLVGLEDLAELETIDADRVLVPVNRTAAMAAPARTPEEVLAWRSRIEAFADR